jgi:cell division protein FtsB
MLRTHARQGISRLPARRLLVIALLAASPAAIAQTADSAGELKAQIAQLNQQLQQQQQLIQQMKQRLDTMEQHEVEQARAAPPREAPEAVAAATKPPIPEAPPKPPSALAGEAPAGPEGYISLGSDNWLKLDVVAQVDTLVDEKRIGTPELFVTSAIPVKGDPFYNSGWRSTLSGKQSIVRLDFQRETPFGTVKVVYKNNFFGSGSSDMNYNLQYLYGELDAETYSFIAGYYLSAFTDIDAFPNTLDYEGPNSFTFKYAPQLRYSPILTKWGDSTLTLPMSIEKPNADISVPDAFGTYSKRPDFTIGLRWNAPDGHLQWANLLRDLAVESSTDNRSRSTSAYATQLSGAVSVFGHDSMQGWLSGGKGYANFLQDISGFGLDAAFNPQLELQAIKAVGGGAGYTHSWAENMSSSFSYGYLRIDPDNDMLIDQALPKSTRYASANFAWQASPHTMIGFEYLWGSNRNLEGRNGDASRVQGTIRYDLNP